ncbi:aspartate 1-decarboxylase [Alicyclobacillus mengziensis]|uniref:Aspartate 1-decarboxylase n=1 Tax=Alicyclobacillus mengziensis TaxID=2931921 RepID=A0A9X7Z4P6_9BACL|nr:aspartate 1-decarboxylase [Alicyclobacillus mengziensis]QSO46174.1 aspartate 1-decarboxylase [Alicyclobacillus mengziensis]
MLRTVCKGKIHRATVTQADLNYMGSITVDAKLLEAANILPYEMVQITNLSNGVIWQTYALAAEENSGTICLNGPPARLFQPGDKVIILSLALMSDDEWANMTSHVIFVDDRNQVTSVVAHRMQDEPGWNLQ